MASVQSTISSENKLPPDPPACKAKLDELINWYEKYKPAAGKEIRVGVLRRTAMRFAKPEKRGGPLFYRGRQILPKTPRPKE